MKPSLLAFGFTAVAITLLSGCATLSEDQCLAGNWADIGYKDGVNGKAPGKLADYAEACIEYGVRPNRDTYLRNYQIGLEDHCTFERGLSRGEDGNAYNQVCTGPLADEYAQGYDQGRALYEIHSEHKRLIHNYDEVADELEDVRRRLSEDELGDDERKRLEIKERRLSDRREDFRIDIRAHERIHGLSRHRFN